MNRLKSFLKTDVGIAVGLTLLWKILLLTIGVIFDSIQGGALSFLDHTMRWDSGWYLTIISDLYATSPASAAFYPLFPLLVSGLHELSFGLIPVEVSGQLINTAAVIALITALLKLARTFKPVLNPAILITLVLCAPAAFFLHAFYGDALFFALTSWAYLLARQKKWMWMGILLALLTASRLPGLLVVGLCGLEFLRAHQWSIKSALNKNFLWFFLAPVGFLFYGTLLFFRNGDFLGMFHAYKATSDWIYQVFNLNILETLARQCYQFLRVLIGERPLDIGFIVNIALPLILIAALITGSVYLLKKGKEYIPLGIYGLVSVVMFTLNSNIVSVHRYILSVLTLYVALALLLHHKGKARPVLLTLLLLCSVATQLWLYWLFIDSTFAG